jgi:ClpP class serine protease
MFNSFFDKRPKLDASKFPHVFSELSNTPVSIEQNELNKFLSTLENKVFKGEIDDVTISSLLPAPRTEANGVRVIPIYGCLLSSANVFEKLNGCTGCDDIEDWLEEALADETVTAIVFDVSSGGGSVKGIQTLADTIASAKDKKPCAAYVGDVAASAAYYLIASLPIYMRPCAEVGSIDVDLTLQDLSGVYDKAGIRVTHLNTSKFKAQMAGDGPYTEGFIAELQKRVNILAERFRNHILAYRPNVDKEQAFNGLTYLDEDAIDIGLADYIVNSMDAVWS